MPASKIKTILKPGAKRTQGRDTWDNNILAAKILGDLLRTSLGPKGFDKMFKDSMDVIVTNDGRTILEKLNLQHPVAKMIAEASKWVDLLVGDGTTTVAILASSLLWKAHGLLDEGIHPSIIADGYLESMEKSMEILDKLAEDADPEDREQLLRVALTSLRTKMIDETALDYVAGLVVDAVLRASEKRPWGRTVERDSIHVVKKYGTSVVNSSLIDGLAIWREATSGTMPTRMENAKIALINTPFEVRKMTVGKPEITINTPQQMKQFIDEEHRMFREMMDKIRDSGANVVICLHGLDDYVQVGLGGMGILGVRRAQVADMKNLEKATGGRIVPIEELTPDVLGHARLIETRKLELENYLFFEGCKNPKASTLLLRGGVARVVDELGRAVEDAIMATMDVIEKPKIIGGGGALEAEIASQLRRWGRTVKGRKQLAVMMFAEALESIPEALAETAGMNKLDSLIELRWRHANGGVWFGVDANEGKISNMFQKGVVEPAKVKTQVLKIAAETAAIVLRIDSSYVAPPKRPHAPTTSMTPGYNNPMTKFRRKYPRPHH